jgi:hypothetical protein
MRYLALKISGHKDNSFPPAGLYLSETTPLSLHFGEPRLPVFLGFWRPASATRAGCLILVALLRQGGDFDLVGSYAAAFLFFPSSFFNTRIPLSMCFSSIKKGGRKRTTVSCVLLNKTPSASPASTIGRAGISN